MGMNNSQDRSTCFIVALVSVLAFVLASMMPVALAQEYNDITSEDAYNALNSGTDVFLLDVRTYSEYVEGHIEGATIIPVDTLDQNQASLPTDKTTMIIVYCKTGNRAATASGQLVGYGYTNVNSIEGGIEVWVQTYDVEVGDPNAENGDTGTKLMSVDDLIIVSIVLIVVVAALVLGMSVMKKRKEKAMEELREKRHSKKSRRR